MSQPNKEKQFLSRRDALKALAAAGGAVALSTLPGKWEKPTVKVGALPALAQEVSPVGTATLRVDNQTGDTVTVVLTNATTLQEYGQKDFAPGTSDWTGIPPGEYFYHYTAPGCNLPGISPQGTLQLLAGEIVLLPITCLD